MPPFPGHKRITALGIIASTLVGGLFASRLLFAAVTGSTGTGSTGSTGNTGVILQPIFDTTPPQVTATHSNLTSTGVTITWTTNEPAKGRIQFGSYDDNLRFVWSDKTVMEATAASGSRTQAIGSLSPSGTYTYRVAATDTSGNNGFSASGTFTTLAATSSTFTKDASLIKLGGAACGNNKCDANENSTLCPSDCFTVIGGFTFICQNDSHCSAGKTCRAGSCVDSLMWQLPQNPTSIAIESYMCKVAKCGDGYVSVTLNEQCDDGARNGTPCKPEYGGRACTYCTTACRVATVTGGYCGDGRLQPSNQNPPGTEQCDGTIGLPNPTAVGASWCMSKKPEDQKINGFHVSNATCSSECQFDCQSLDSQLCVNSGALTDAVTGLREGCDPDLDNDGFPNVNDCAPTNAAISPGAKEVCNNIDDNCDGNIDDYLLLTGKVVPPTAGIVVTATCVGQTTELATNATLADGSYQLGFPPPGCAVVKVKPKPPAGSNFCYDGVERLVELNRGVQLCQEVQVKEFNFFQKPPLNEAHVALVWSSAPMTLDAHVKFDPALQTTPSGQTCVSENGGGLDPFPGAYRKNHLSPTCANLTSTVGTHVNDDSVSATHDTAIEMVKLKQRSVPAGTQNILRYYITSGVREDSTPISSSTPTVYLLANEGGNCKVTTFYLEAAGSSTGNISCNYSTWHVFDLKDYTPGKLVSAALVLHPGSAWNIAANGGPDMRSDINYKNGEVICGTPQVQSENGTVGGAVVNTGTSGTSGSTGTGNTTPTNTATTTNQTCAPGEHACLCVSPGGTSTSSCQSESEPCPNPRSCTPSGVGGGGRGGGGNNCALLGTC